MQSASLLSFPLHSILRAMFFLAVPAPPISCLPMYFQIVPSIFSPQLFKVGRVVALESVWKPACFYLLFSHFQNAVLQLLLVS